MKISGDKSDLSISQAGTAAVQCEDPTQQLPITQLPGPLENMDSSQNGELTAPGTEDASEGSSVIPQNEGSSQTVTTSEETESKPMEIGTSLATEKESELKDLKATDLSSEDEVKRDSSKKKSKKHKKHKSKKKKKKKKKEKNEKRSKSTSSGEDQENASPELKSVWKPVLASPREQDTLNTVSSQVEENVDVLPSLGVQDHIADSIKENPARPLLDIESGFFGPKCPNEMHFSVSSNNVTVCEVEMPEPSKEPAVDSLQNIEVMKCTDQNNEKQHTNCEAAEALQKEVSLPQPDLVLLEEKSLESEGSMLNSEGNKAEQADNASLPSQPQSTSAVLPKSTAKSRSRSNSLVRENRSRSKSLIKLPKKQASSKSTTRQRSRSSSIVRRQRSRSSSVGQRRRSKSKSPVRRRRSQSSSPVRYSRSPIRSWWSKSIRNRQRSVSIERRRRSRTRSLAKRRRSKSRSSEKGRYSRTRSSAKRLKSRSRSADRRRKSRSTSRKHRLRSRSGSRRKSKSAIRTSSKSNSPSRKRRSKSASPLRRQKSKTLSPARRGRSRSRSAVQKRRSRSGAASRRQRSRSVSGYRRRKSKSGSFTRRGRSGSATRRRRSRSSLASRRRKSRSVSAVRRRRSRSAVTSRRRKSRSASVSKRRRSRSASVSRRRRSRSTSVSRRRRSRSTSVSRRRRSRSASVSRRRRSRSASVSRRRRSRSASVSRRRRSKSTSASRRRRSRSTSRRRRSRSASRRRRSRSASASRRRKSGSASRRRRSRSTSASRRHKSRSGSRRRKSRSYSGSRRRRSRSDSASRRRRSRSGSASKRDRSKFDSVSRRRKSRSSSNTRRRRSGSNSGRQRQKSPPSSATKRKSRSSSAARGEQSTLSSASKVQSAEDRISSSALERRSRSRGKDQKSRSRSRSVNLNSVSVEGESTLASKSSTENSVPETVSLDEKQFSVSTSTPESIAPSLAAVEKHNEVELPDKSSSCNKNAIEMESNTLDYSSTTSVLADPMKSTYAAFPTEHNVSSDTTECDMDIEPVAFTPIQTNCSEHASQVVYVTETSNELDNTNDRTKVVDPKTDDDRTEDGTVLKLFSSFPDVGQQYGPSQLAGTCTTEYSKSEFLDENYMDPTKLSCLSKPNVDIKPEFTNAGSDSVCRTSLKARENSADRTAASTNVKLASTDPLPNCLGISRDPESIKCMKDVDTVEPEVTYLTERESISSTVSDHSHLTVKKNLSGLLAENQIKHLQSGLPTDYVATEGKSCGSPVTSNKEFDVLYNKQENITNSLISNESQNLPALDSPSRIFPVDQKHTEAATTEMLEDKASHQRGTPKSSTLDEDVVKQTCLKEKHEMQYLGDESKAKKKSKSKEEILEACPAQADLQRIELKLFKSAPAVEQSISSPPKLGSGSNETENTSASSCAAQIYSDNPPYKELVSKDICKETSEPEVLHVIENKTIEIKPMSSENLGNSCQTKESNTLIVSSSHKMNLLNTSGSLEVGKRNVQSLLKEGGDEPTSMEENSASNSALQNSSVPPNVDSHEPSKSKGPTTLADSTITDFSAPASPSKSILVDKLRDLSSEKNPKFMSITPADSERSSLTDKMENQRPYEKSQKTSNAESHSEHKTVSKASTFNSRTKQEAGKSLSGDSARSEVSANSFSSRDSDLMCPLEKTGNSKEQNSLTVLPGEKQSNMSKSSDGNLKELSQNIVTQRDTVVSKHTRSIPVSKESEGKCLTNSTDDEVILNAVNDNYISQKKTVQSCEGTSPSSYIQEKAIPTNEERMNVEEERSHQSFTEVKQLEVEKQEQSVFNYSKNDSAYVQVESKAQEDPNSPPKTFLQETGRLSVSSVPVQFKFSKTFKTLGVSQLCSTSEDSSDVETSKVNTSSSGVVRNTPASTSDTLKSSSKIASELLTARKNASVNVETSKSSSPLTVASQNSSTEPSQSDYQSEKDLLQPDNIQSADDSQTGSSTKHTFPHLSNAVSKLGVKQRQYRSRSVAQNSRTPSVDRGHTSRSRSKSLSRRRRSHSKSSSRKKRSESAARKKSSHSKSVRKKRSRSRSRGRKGRSQSKSKGKKKRSTSKLSAKRKRSRSKSSERIGGSKSSGRQRSSRSTSKTRKNRSKSPEKKGRSRSKSEARKSLHSKTASTRKRSRSKSPNRRRKSRSKSLSSRSRSRSLSTSWKRFSHSKSSLHRKRSHSSSRSASPKRRSRSRNIRRSFSRSPAARSNSRSRSRWHRSRSRGRWRRSRSLSTSRRRSRSTSRLSSSLSSKKRKSLSPVRRRRSRSQVKQKDKSPVSKRKSSSPQPLLPPLKKSVQSKPAGFKHSIGLKSLIQKQLSQAKSQGSTGKLSKEQIPLPNLSSRTRLSIFSARTQASVSNLSTLGQIAVPNLAEVPLPSVSTGSQVPMHHVPPSEPLSVSSLAAETQLSVPDLTTANQWHVPDMSSGASWSVPDIAAGTQWSMADMGAAAQWPMSDLTAGSHWPMHDLTVGAQWSMPDLAAGTQWAVPDVATGAQWAVPDLTAGTQWTVPDLTAGSQWAMASMTAGAQWAVPDLAATAQWAVPDLTAGAQMQRADLAPEAQVPGSDLAPEAQVPGSDLAAEAQVPGSDLAAEAQVPGSDLVAEAQVPLEHDLVAEEHNMMPDVAAEALVPVASSTIVPDVAARIPLPDVTAAAQMPVPDVAATIHMPDVATEAQRQMSDYVATQAYMSLLPEESVEDSCYAEQVVTSECEPESDSSDAFAQQSSFEPIVNTSQNLKMEETLSAEQQLAVDFESSQSSEVNNTTISLNKHDLQVNQEPEADLLLNLPQAEPAIDSESHVASEACRPPDVPFVSVESTDYSGQSISVESNPMEEHRLIDDHKSSDISSPCDQSASSSDFLVASHSSPIPAECDEPSGDCDQPLLAATNAITDSNLQDELDDHFDPTLIEQSYSKSVCPERIAPYVSTENISENEPSVNSDTTLEINSHISSDPNKTEESTSKHVEQSPSLDLRPPTEHCASPEHPQLVEPYTSPVHPQLVEPYTSPVRPQLVEPYSSPPHPPLVELYSSPDRPQLVEPYASPDFPQLVEPYASPDRQQLVEPYTNTEHTQVCQPCISPVMTENTCSPVANPDENSISGHILTYATVTCTEINTDTSCSDGLQIKKDFSLLNEYGVTSDVSKPQDDVVDSDYSQFSKSDNASPSLQEVPCPSLVKAHSLDSSFSPKETTVEESSPIEQESVEISTGSYVDCATSPAQLLDKNHCSPYAVHQEESSITEQKPPYSHTSPVEHNLSEECVEQFQSKEVHEDLISSEQVQEKLYDIPVKLQENVPSPSIPHINEQCLNTAHALFAENEDRPAEDPINHPDQKSFIPVLSNTIINVDSSCTITPSPGRTEQETVTEHSHTEVSKATSGCGLPEQPITTPDDEVVEKPVDEELEKPVDEELEKPVDEELEKPVDEELKKPVDEELEKPVDELLEKPIDELLEKSVDEMLEKPVDEVLEKPVDELLEKSVDEMLEKPVDEVLEKPSPCSDSAMPHDSQDSRCSSPSKPLSDSSNCFVPEQSSNADHSTPSEYFSKSSKCLDQTIKADDSPTFYQSQELTLDSHAENPLPSETASLPANLPHLDKDKLPCSTPFQASDLSVECIEHKPEVSDECIKMDNHFTTTPPDLLPYDSDQPTDVCSEPEPVPFNSQPPPELLPYDSEQPTNSFLSISEFSAEQGSSDFYAPPELLPYDSEQPVVLQRQQKESSAELAVYDSTTVHHETYRTLDPPSVDSVENCGNSASLNIPEVPEKCEPFNEAVNPPSNFDKEVSSECAVVELSATEQTFTSETVQEHSVPSAVVDCTQEHPRSALSSTDEHLPAQQLAENEQPVVQPVLGAAIPEPLNSTGVKQTEQTPLTNIAEVRCSSSNELDTSDSETSTALPSMEDDISLETKESLPPISVTNTDCPQPQPLSRKTDPVVESKSRKEHSRSKSIERKKSSSTSTSQNKRSRSKSVSPIKKSKSLVSSRRSKSRSASAESNRRSPSVVKRKESTYVAHKRSSRSASVGRRKRSRSSSSPRKRSHSPSVGRKSRRRRSHSRSPSVTGRRRSRSSSVTRKRRSPSTSTTRKKSSSPVTRRRRSPSAPRRRRSPSTSAARRRRSPSPATRRRRSPSPSASRRRRSPSTTRRRRSRSPSATRRRRSPSTSRRRRSPSPSASRRRRSPSPIASRRRRSPSPPVSRRRRSPSSSTTRRRRSPSPSASRRRRSPSSSDFRRKRSPSLSHKRHSRSPSLPRKRRSRSTSASRRRRSRSTSQRKRSRSPSVPRKRRSKSKSQSKSPTGIQSKSDRSRSVSQSEGARKRKTRSRSSSRDKKTAEKRRKRSSSKDSSKDYYSIKQRRKSRTPPRRKKSRSPNRRASVCKSPVRRRRSRSPIRRKSFSRSPIRRKRSRSRDKSLDSVRSPKRLTDLDKAQLLEIAKANAAAMCAKAGVPLPPSLKPALSTAVAVEEKITHRTYGVTIQELTEKCKQIAQSKEDDVIVNKPHDSDDEEEDRPFYNHPFKVSEHKPISFSLLNPSLKPAPKNQVTLTKEFPVSSGSQHRKKESDKVYGEWVPVDKNTEESKDDVFTNTGPTQPVDITSAMNERATAQTRLTGNPYDIEALFMLNRAQEQIDAWAQSTSIPGQFTGSTGAQVLSAEEISNSGPQAWLKKQVLKRNRTPV